MTTKIYFKMLNNMEHTSNKMLSEQLVWNSMQRISSHVSNMH